MRRRIDATLRELLGADMALASHRVEQTLQGPGGKIKTVISRLPLQEMRSARSGSV